MDALFHVAMTFAGGYMLFTGLKVKFRWSELFLFSLLAGMIDVDHFYRPFGDMLLFHNVFFIIGVPVALFLLFRHIGMKKHALYGLSLMVFWTGHILADMASSLYGVYILFPAYSGMFLLPDWMNMWKVGRTYAIETAGFAVAIYFAIIFCVIVADRKRKGKDLGF